MSSGPKVFHSRILLTITMSFLDLAHNVNRDYLKKLNHFSRNFSSDKNHYVFELLKKEDIIFKAKDLITLNKLLEVDL